MFFKEDSALLIGEVSLLTAEKEEVNDYSYSFF